MKNVLGTDLKLCSKSPLTGYFRDGFCRTDSRDLGRHVVACIMTDEFLKFSKLQGNDLSTPNLVYGFPGLKKMTGGAYALLAGKKHLTPAAPASSTGGDSRKGTRVYQT